MPDLDELENGHRDYDVDEELEEEEDEVPTDDENDEDFNFKAPAPKGPGKGGKRGPARAAATKGKGKGRATYAEDDDEEERPVVARTKDDFEVAGDNSLFSKPRPLFEANLGRLIHLASQMLSRIRMQRSRAALRTGSLNMARMKTRAEKLWRSLSLSCYE